MRLHDGIVFRQHFCSTQPTRVIHTLVSRIAFSHFTFHFIVHTTRVKRLSHDMRAALEMSNWIFVGNFLAQMAQTLPHMGFIDVDVCAENIYSIRRNYFQKQNKIEKKN